MASLQEQLDRFTIRQEKCQSMLTNIAKHNSKTKTIPPTKATLSTTTLPSPPIKFSNNTERLQHINTIRNSPHGAQLKRVIDLLLEKRQPLTPEQINDECYVNINSNKVVFDSLRNNPKVRYDGKRFSYRSKHDIRDKDELLMLIKKFPEGMPIKDLTDAYPTVMDDLQLLKADGKVWLMSNFDANEDIVYPNTELRVPIKVDSDLKELFRGIELPRDMLDIEKDIQKNGMKPATNTAKRRAEAEIHGIPRKTEKPKSKKREITKRTKVTNTHLPELIKKLSGK